MDYKRIIRDGYGKLAEYLPDYEKGILECFSIVKEDLDSFCIEDIVEHQTILGKIKEEITSQVINDIKEWLDYKHDELEVQIDNVGLFVKENVKYINYIGNINYHLNYIFKTIRSLREDINTLIKIKAIEVC